MSKIPERPFGNLKPVPIERVNGNLNGTPKLIKVVRVSNPLKKKQTNKPQPLPIPNHKPQIQKKQTPIAAQSGSNPVPAKKKVVVLRNHVLPSSPPAEPTNTSTPADSPLFVLKDGQMRRIKKSNVSFSGIVKIKLAHNNDERTLTPIQSNYILNNDIEGGIMTMSKYRSKVNTFQQNQKALRKKDLPEPVTIYKVIQPNDIDLDLDTEKASPEPPKRKKPGRKKGVSIKKAENVSSILLPVPSGARTRSGRVSRPPRHIQRFYTNAEVRDENAPRESIYLEEEETQEQPPVKKPKRIGGERFKCSHCGKSYVNERMLQTHLHVAHGMHSSDGLPLDNDNQKIDCFNYLMARLKRVPIKLRGKVFLDEMEAFVKKMHKLVEKLIRKRPMEGSFLNYSQVHQVPKMLEGLLNVPPGQYHFNTEVIDSDEKTILGEGLKGQERGSDRERPKERPKEPHDAIEGESAQTGFDDASLIISGAISSSANGAVISGGDNDNAIVKEPSFADHIISLEDVIYGTPTPYLGTGAVIRRRGILSSDHDEYEDDEEDAGEEEEQDEDDEDHEEEEEELDEDLGEEEEDDLTTPKKEFPSPNNTRTRLKKLKRVRKNLNDSGSFPGIAESAGQHHRKPPVILQNISVTSDQLPIIKDLSMELFQTRDSCSGPDLFGN